MQSRYATWRAHRRLIGIVAAFMLGVSGIAGVMAGVRTWTPSATDRPASGDLPGKMPAQAGGDGHARIKCIECGVVESTREIALPGTSSRRYEVTVRMKDGSSRVVRDTNAEHWRVGARVIVIDGESPASD